MHLLFDASVRVFSSLILTFVVVIIFNFLIQYPPNNMVRIHTFNRLCPHTSVSTTIARQVPRKTAADGKKNRRWQQERGGEGGDGRGNASTEMLGKLGSPRGRYELLRPAKLTTFSDPLAYVEVHQATSSLSVSSLHFIVSQLSFSGHIEMWARSNTCPWGASTSSRAASGGHLGYPRREQSNACLWHKEMNYCNPAGRGQFVLFRWARSNSPTTIWRAVVLPRKAIAIFPNGRGKTYVPAMTASGRTLNGRGITTFLRTQGPTGAPGLHPPALIMSLLFVGYVGVLDWVRSNGCP